MEITSYTTIYGLHLHLFLLCTYIREARVFLVINWGQKLMALRQIGLRVLSSAGTETETEKTEKTEKHRAESIKIKMHRIYIHSIYTEYHTAV